MFEYRTRGNSSPQGRQKVYFTCAPEDHDIYFEKTAEQILSVADCSVWFLRSGEYEDIVTDLSGMSLFVIPVTTRLLTADNRTLGLDLPFAEEHRVPVLPLMMESGLDELFAEHFGDRHYLDPNAKDDTAISFSEKFKRFLLSVIVGDELAERVRQAFDAYIFLSYRKKDRRYAQELMRLIHNNGFCRDIAIWYDEFLTPGEDFNNAISGALKKSKLFALVVTPNLINEENYVQSVEYPMALEAHKPVIPAEMVETDAEGLSSLYPGIGETVSADKLPEALIEGLKGVALLSNDNEPEHNFFIGLAYLGGIDVEKNYERALKLIESAAEHGVAEAVKKLVDMYESGEGVERDYRTAVEWQKKLAAVYEARAAKNREPESCIDHLEALNLLQRKILSLGDPEGAEPYCELLYKKAVEYIDVAPELKRYESLSLEKLGMLHEEMGDIEGAKRYYTEALEIDERLTADTDDAKAMRDLSFSLNNLCNVLYSTGDLKGAEDYCRRALAIREKLAAMNGTAKARGDVSASLTTLGDILESLGDIKGAKEVFARSLELDEELLLEEGTAEAETSLTVSLDRYANMLAKEGRLKEALEYYKRSYETSERLASTRGMIKDRRGMVVSLIKLGETVDSLGLSAEAEEYYTRALETAEKLAEEINTVSALSDLAVCLTSLGECLTARDDNEGAESLFERALKISEGLAERTKTAKAEREVSVSLDRLGEIRRDAGDTAGARECFERSLEIAERLAENSDSLTAKRDLITRLRAIGALLTEIGEYDGAEGYYIRALELSERLIAEADTNETQRELSVSLGYLGALRVKTDDIDGAEECFIRSLKIAEKLAESINTLFARRDLSISCGRLGDLYHGAGNEKEAEKYYLRALEIDRSVKEETGTVQAVRDLSITLRSIGSVRLSMQDTDGAEEAFKTCAALARELMDMTGSIQAKRELSVYYGKLAEVSSARGDNEGAEKMYLAALEIDKSAAEELKTADALNDYAVTLTQLAMFKKENGAYEESEDYCIRAIETMDELGGMTYEKDCAAVWSAIADVLEGLAEIYSEEGDTDGAKDRLDIAVTIREDLAEEGGADEYVDLAYCCYLRATLDEPHDLELLRRAHGIYGELCTEYPDDERYKEMKKIAADAVKEAEKAANKTKSLKDVLNSKKLF